MGKILDRLSIFGIPERIENGILASLTLGDPALLIGAPGTAKTDTVQMIGSALRERSRQKHPNEKEKWLNFAIYDASKIEYEDLLGIMNAKALSEGRMEYIHTPTTVWGKRLVCYDEFNRTNPDRQSNLLEHIRSRTIQGLPTGTQFILAAMNPYGDTGTEELSDALVDRFLYYLEFPEFDDFPDPVKQLIIERIGQADCVALKKFWDGADNSLTVKDDEVNDHLAEAGNHIETMIGRSMVLFGEIQKEYGNKITNLIRQCFDSLNADMEGNTDERVSLLSGRRAGLVRRGLLAHRAVELAKGEVYGTEVTPLIQSLREVFPMCMPFGVSGRATPDQVTRLQSRLFDDVSTFWSAIEDENDDVMTDVVYELFRTKSLHRQLYLLLRHGKKLDKQMETEAWTRLTTDGDFNFSDVLQVISTHMPDRIPENVQLPPPSTADPATNLENFDAASLVNDELACKGDIQALVEKWKNKPVLHYYVARSLRACLGNDETTALGEIELRRRLEDINTSAAELETVIDECDKVASQETSIV